MTTQYAKINRDTLEIIKYPIWEADNITRMTYDGYLLIPLILDSYPNVDKRNFIINDVATVHYDQNTDLYSCNVTYDVIQRNSTDIGNILTFEKMLKKI